MKTEIVIEQGKHFMCAICTIEIGPHTVVGTDSIVTSLEGDHDPEGDLVKFRRALAEGALYNAIDIIKHLIVDDPTVLDSLITEGGSQ